MARGVVSHQHRLLPERRVPSWLSVATSLQCPPWRSSELGSGLLLSQPLAPGPLFLWAVGLCEDEVGGVPRPGPLLPTMSPGEERGFGRSGFPSTVSRVSSISRPGAAPGPSWYLAGVV